MHILNAGRRHSRALLLCLGLTLPTSVFAAPVFCDRLPASDRAAAKESGRCVDRISAKVLQQPAYVRGGTVVQPGAGRMATIEVPDVVGRDVIEAKQQLGRFKVSTAIVSSLRLRDEVVAQEPARGTQAPLASAVMLILSDGSLVEVPSVLGQPRADAQALLEQTELRAQTDEEDSEAPMGEVVSQDPEAGRATKRQSTVRLRISAGLRLPSAVGQQDADARSTLKDFVIRTEIVKNKQRAGEVLTQSPAAGERASAGSTVALKVSDGSIVIVPDLHGMKLADARLTLQHTGGLLVQVADGAARDDAIVNETIPSAGQPVDRASTIILRLAFTVHWLVLVASAAAALIALVAGRKLWQQWHPTIKVGMDRNVIPVEALAHGPEVPAIELRTGLQRGAVKVRQHEETLP